MRISDWSSDVCSSDLHLPGVGPGETNRYNVLGEPYLEDGTAALLGPGRAAFIDRYKFDIAPATDDRPYFFDFFRWRALPELLALRTQGGGALIDWGYLILSATLVQAGQLTLALTHIGRASSMPRLWQSVEIAVGAGV